MLKIKNNKTAKLSAIFLLVIFSLASFSFVFAIDIATQSFIRVDPTPVGAGQTVTILVWVQPVPTSVTTANGVWEEITIEITKPDGSILTIGPFTSNYLGCVCTQYVPDEVGSYEFQAIFPGQPSTTGDYFVPSTSSEEELFVQEDSVDISDFPISEDYWERPVSPVQDLNWAICSGGAGIGNWLMPGYDVFLRSMYSSGAFAPYNDGPETAHVMWKKALAIGGVIGGEFGGLGYNSGLPEEVKFYPPVIIAGNLYYNIYPKNSEQPGFVCVDLRTGEELWRNEEGRIDMGQVLYYGSSTTTGGMPYLWEFNHDEYRVYDAFTGDLVQTVFNAQTGTPVLSQSGEVLVYILDSGENLLKWNSNKYPIPSGGDVDWNDGIEWIRPIPNRGGTESIAGFTVNNEVIVTYVYTLGATYFRDVGYSAITGDELWVEQRSLDVPTYPGNLLFDHSRIHSGKYVYRINDNATSSGFDINTGEQLWGTEPPIDTPFPLLQTSSVLAYEKYFLGCSDGTFYAYDIDSGSLSWKYSPHENDGLFGGVVAGDNKIYAGFGGYPTSINPLDKLFAVDADFGELVWSISGSFISPSNAIADGYLVGFNAYDNNIYCFGKGPSKTTVTGPLTAVTSGTSVIITGTVTDQSTAQVGTPCIADEYMSEWMEYLHMGKPIPQNAKGVTVQLLAVDPNDNVMPIGSTTSDTSGNYGFMWRPPTEGLYQIIAVFEGTDSYGSSSDTTYIGVDPASSADGQIEPEFPIPIFELVLLVIIVVIAVVLISMYIFIKKRK